MLLKNKIVIITCCVATERTETSAGMDGQTGGDAQKEPLPVDPAATEQNEEAQSGSDYGEQRD